MILITPHYHNLYKNIFLINFLDPNFTKDYQSFLSECQSVLHKKRIYLEIVWLWRISGTNWGSI